MGKITKSQMEQYNFRKAFFKISATLTNVEIPKTLVALINRSNEI